jgi:hypothetical protein
MTWMIVMMWSRSGAIYRLVMTKRFKFIIAAAVMSLTLWGQQFIVPEHRIQAIVVAVVLAYLISAWVLFEDLKGVEWVIIMVLPVLYTLGAGLFSLFLPEAVPRVLGQRLEADVARLVASGIKLFFWTAFGIGFYAMYLTENIFSVAAIRTIQLLRAAHAVGFLLTLVVGLFLFHALISFKLSFWLMALLAGGLSLPLLLQGNWSMQLKEGLSKRVWRYSLVGAIVVAQVALALSFWPIEGLTASLMMVTAMYVVLGLSQQYLVGRLFKNQVTEYMAVAGMVLLASFYITSWR